MCASTLVSTASSSVRSTVPSLSSTQKRPLTGRSRPPVVAMNVGRPVSLNSIIDARIGVVALSQLELEALAMARGEKRQRERRHVDVPVDVADVVARALRP